MILRKDYVKLIQSGKVQVKVEKTKQHNEMLNIIFPKRRDIIYLDLIGMYNYYCFDNEDYYGYSLKRNPFEDLPIIQAEDIILDNTVIKVESEEQGKKVIEWWKEQGVDVIGYMGTSIGYYYGIFDGQFKICKKDYFIKDKKIITLPETFTEKWYMSITDENKEIKQEPMRTIKWQQAQEIIDVACYDWKEKLIERWAKNIVLREDVHVSDSSYRIMRKACTEDQNKLFDNIFGSDKEDIDLLEGKGIGDRKVFKLGGDDSNCLMANYACGRDQIWLNPIFNWTLEDNILTVSHRD